MSTNKTCTNCPGATDHDTAHCPLGGGFTHFPELLESVQQMDAMLKAEGAQVEREARADIACDAAYRNGVMHGYKLAMSDVKRYNANVFFPGCLGPVSREVVLADDAEKLEAEAQALREERNSLDRQLTQLTAEAAAMGEELEALRAGAVVAPEHRVLPNYTDHPLLYCEMTGFNNCLDELARLNGKAVSGGLLRRLGQVISWQCFGDCRAFSDQRIPEPSEVIEELRDLLGERNDT